MAKASWEADSGDVEAIVEGRHADPFGILGLQQIDGAWVARTFIPHAESVAAFDRVGAPIGELTLRDSAGFFEGLVTVSGRQTIRYHARNAGGEWDVFDPYSFGPVLGPMDDYYIAEGSLLRLFD